MKTTAQIYELLGSSQSPVNNRKMLIEDLKIYLKACDKLETFKILSQKMHALFAKYNSINVINFKVKSNALENLQILSFKSKKNPNVVIDYEQVEHDIKLAFWGTYRLEEVLKHYHNEEIDCFFMSKESLNITAKDILLPKEFEIYEGVENCEKHKLEQIIATNSKKSKLAKI